MGRLTDRSVKNAGPGPHIDGDGLQLKVLETGSRSWVFRYQTRGTRHDMGLGPYPAVSLSEARIATAEARKLLARGIDPIQERQTSQKSQKPVPTFEEVAKDVIADAQKASTNAKCRYQWERHLGPAYCSKLLSRPVNEITTIDVAAVLRPVWGEKPEVARKLHPAIHRVFEHARILLRDEHKIAMPDNPARWADLKAMGFSAPAQLSKGSHPSLHYSELPAFVAELQSRDAVAARMLEFLILTNVRTEAVLKARWDDIDTEKSMWTVPLASLKDRKYRKAAFRVPLSNRALDLVKILSEIKFSPFVFPSQSRDRPLSNMAMLTLLKRMNGEKPRWVDANSKRPITAHGFRATFRTWAEETMGFPHAVIEEAMGHKVGTLVERAYRRTDVLEQRRALMEAWASFMEPKASNVVQLTRDGVA